MTPDRFMTEFRKAMPSWHIDRALFDDDYAITDAECRTVAMVTFAADKVLVVYPKKRGASDRKHYANAEEALTATVRSCTTLKRAAERRREVAESKAGEKHDKRMEENYGE
jgi:hypothetical protein